jgi:hypothetical protein
MLTLWMWLGCAKAPLDAGDATLPEAVVDVAAQAPAEVLEGATASLEPSLRARAIALTVLTTADLDRWGPRGLWDPSPWVQRAAIEALDTRDAHDLLTSFVGRADAAPTSRALAALALDPGAVSLSDAWRAAEAPWTRAPLALAAWHHGDDDALPALTAALATGELDVDAAFFAALAQRSQPDVLAALAEAQARAEPELAIQLAATRLRCGDAKAAVPLRKALDGSAEEQLEALDALGALPGAAADELITRAASSAHELVRRDALLLAAARLGQQPERLTDALDDPDREVRLFAVAASRIALAQGPASRQVAKEARRALVEALVDPDLQVRAEAARGVGEHRVVEARAALEALLTDEVAWVRVEAAGALLALDQRAGE